MIARGQVRARRGDRSQLRARLAAKRDGDVATEYPESIDFTQPIGRRRASRTTPGGCRIRRRARDDETESKVMHIEFLGDGKQVQLRPDRRIDVG